MPRLTAREKQLVRKALRIAQETDEFYENELPPSNGDVRAKVGAEIREIEYKLSAAWNRTP